MKKCERQMLKSRFINFNYKKITFLRPISFTIYKGILLSWQLFSVSISINKEKIISLNSGMKNWTVLACYFVFNIFYVDYLKLNLFKGKRVDSGQVLWSSANEKFH